MTSAGVIIPDPSGPAPGELRADCEHCFGLCCVAPAFARSSDFAVTKPAGKPCVNLDSDYRCRIHDRLRPDGFPGCVVYDCFGAGQKIAQQTFGGVSWRSADDGGSRMFAAFAVMRDLHELLYYLTEALTFQSVGVIREPLQAALADTAALTRCDVDGLSRIDIDAVRARVNPLLQQASKLQRAHLPGHVHDHRGANLIGAALKGVDLRGASFRGALLIGADLRNARLDGADFTGADLRGADLGGASLTDAIFLTQSQLEAAKGDRIAKLSSSLRWPSHWVSG